MRLIPALLLLAPALPAALSEEEKPNLVFIMADDLGWGDLGCYGGKVIQTPCIDRMAVEGMKFTSAYCGTSVCAPSRCALLTGLHMGRAPIRANREIQPEGQMPLPEGTVTVGHLLQRAGYRTACIGKWGLGPPGSHAVPNRMGFDHFFGYLCQRHAHGYYPSYLWRNGEKLELDGRTYSHDRMTEEAFHWIRQVKDRPFFLYLAYTIPHSRFEVPDLGPYADEPWPPPEKAYAAMVTRMDRDVGRLLTLLKELELEAKTLVFFTSDNGAAHEWPRFDNNGPWRGIKRSLYEGGLRVPALAWWPGKIRPGSVSEQPWAFWDFLATAVELAGGTPPPDLRTDGISIVPALRGNPLPPRECLYWELHEGPMKQAVRFGDWKAVRNAIDRPLELYHLKADPGEREDVAGEHPEITARAEALLKAARVDSPDWPVKTPAKKKKG